MLGLIFPSWRFYQGRGPSLASFNLRCTVPSPPPSQHTAACTLHAELLPGWGQETTSLCTSLISMPSCKEWEQIVPTSLPSCWQGRQLHVQVLCPARYSSLFKKSLSGLSRCSTELLSAFHMLHFSKKPRVYLHHGQPWPLPACRSRYRQYLSHSLVLSGSPSSRGVPLAGCVYSLVLPCDFGIQVTPGWAWGFPALGGEGCTRLLSLTRLSMDAGLVAG